MHYLAILHDIFKYCITCSIYLFFIRYNYFLLQSRFRLASEAIKLDFTKLNPIAGF